MASKSAKAGEKRKASSSEKPSVKSWAKKQKLDSTRESLVEDVSDSDDDVSDSEDGGARLTLRNKGAGGIDDNKRCKSKPNGDATPGKTFERGMRLGPEMKVTRLG